MDALSGPVEMVAMKSGSFDPLRPVAIIGAGVMGTKVAWACARVGLRTRLFDTQAGKAAESRQRACSWGDASDQAAVREHLEVVDDLSAALRQVQLAFENVPEKLVLKRQVLAEVSARLSPEAYVGSNASSLLCTPLAEVCACTERFFCLNFTDPRSQRLVELMTCQVTAVETIRFARDWARHIRMVPIRVRREQIGYSFNRLWRVIKKEVLRQIAEGYATPHDIDRAWMLTFGTSQGPCGLMDDIGLHSVLNVERVYHADSGEDSDRPPQFLIDMVERREWGEITGRGFYEYPNPAYRRPTFLVESDDD
jgi:3-hydroxybutyryl-CoA dehydrogenase